MDVRHIRATCPPLIHHVPDFLSQAEQLPPSYSPPKHFTSLSLLSNSVFRHVISKAGAEGH
jgi:hypothetical protein